tara:strand:+ start:69 stop:194 length:126 start_codon:yes stop_codon:yes gene_type:complete
MSPAIFLPKKMGGIALLLALSIFLKKQRKTDFFAKKNAKKR